MAHEKEQSPNKPEELRIGVFICHCGLNIAGVLDIKELVEYAKLCQTLFT
jgi:heterodisulfide reductase subunit A